MSWQIQWIFNLKFYGQSHCIGLDQFILFVTDDVQFGHQAAINKCTDSLYIKGIDHRISRSERQNENKLSLMSSFTCDLPAKRLCNQRSRIRFPGGRIIPSPFIIYRQRSSYNLTFFYIIPVVYASFLHLLLLFLIWPCSWYSMWTHIAYSIQHTYDASFKCTF